MKKKYNKSMKITIASSVVIITLVGLSVFSLRSLADRKNDSELAMTSANNDANKSTSKLLTRVDETNNVEYITVSAPVTDEPEEVYSVEPAVAEVLQAEIKDFVIVDNVVEADAAPIEITAEYFEEKTVSEAPVMSMIFIEQETETPETIPVYEEPTYEEPVYEEPTYEEPVYEEPTYEEPVYEEPTYEEPVYEEPTYEEPTYEEPTYEDPVYEEPETEDPWFNSSTIDSEEEESEEISNEESSEESTDTETDTDVSEEESWSGNNDYNESEYDTSDELEDSEQVWEDNTEEEEEENNNSNDDSEDSGYEDVESNSYLGQAIVNYAAQWVGVTPYVDAYERWTGSYYYNSLIDGTDCSGFTHLIYSEFGIYLPTGSDIYQYGVGTQITYDQLLPGDIVVYRFGGHVAIYAGDDTIIHCANPDLGTIYSNMWYSTPTAYLRVVY